MLANGVPWHPAAVADALATTGDNFICASAVRGQPRDAVKDYG